jgi:hypothetical protein
MSLNNETLELQFDRSDYGLSARRLWEHTELGQINVFKKAISTHNELNDAAMFIDVVVFDDEVFSLVGLTLAELKTGRIPSGVSPRIISVLIQFREDSDATAFVRTVAEHLDLCAIRKGVRNQHHRFLPTPQSDDVFGVPGVYSGLQRRLLGMGKARAGGEQWLRTIQNFQQKGLRTEELEWADLIPDLTVASDDDEQFSAKELSDLCDFKELRISVMPVVSDAQHQLRFAGAPERALKRTKKLPKAQVGQSRTVVGFDPVLGYRIEQVEHQTLWGKESHWQAVMHEGLVIRNVTKQSLFATRQDAATLAADHAKQNFPKRLALGRYSSYAWTGGESYREWLITLPYLRESYLSGHFNIRNVLAHVRCDVREGTDGERVLMLQEVQSDWAQRARKALSTGVMDADDESPPPFMKEWSALALKLVLLHASHEGLDAVAWTRGMHQAHRYGGSGAIGLNELYDRTLPREVNRMMKPFGGKCEMLGVYVPTNFSIRQTELGYEVYSPEKELLGTAHTLEEARQFVPDEGHELLYDVHGIRLPAAMRKAILVTGFPAWG